MSNLQAAIGCGQMERIEELIAGKRKVFEYYRDALRTLSIRMNPEPVGTTNGYWMPTIVIDDHVAFDRAALLEAFKADHIDGRVFFWPLSSLPSFKPHPAHAVSHSLSSRAINLPSYHDMTYEDQDRVIACVDKLLAPES